jgi:hypothetical protein
MVHMRYMSELAIVRPFVVKNGFLHRLLLLLLCLLMCQQTLHIKIGQRGRWQHQD